MADDDAGSSQDNSSQDNSSQDSSSQDSSSQDAGTSTPDTPDPAVQPDSSDATCVENSSNDADQNLGQSAADGSDAGSPSCPESETGDLAVTVTDSATGQPISGADVQISGPTSAESATDDSGAANFTGIPAGSYSITAIKDGYSNGSGSADVAASESNTASVSLTSTAPATGDLGVTVTDSLTGEPISGATVQVSGPDSASATTDDSGTANFTGISTGDYTISASKDGYSSGSGNGTVEANQSTPVSASLTPATGSLGVTVTDSSTGQPISGVNVEISGAGSGADTTDDSGNVNFTGLPAGDYSITAVKDGYDNGTGSGSVSAGVSSTAGVALAPKTGDLQVTVSDANTNQPLQGADVQVSGPATRNAVSDASGIAAFSGLLPGDYTIAATMTSYNDGSGSVTVSAESSNTAAVALTPMPGGLTVTVIDSTTSQPIAGATIQISGASSSNGTADATGVATFNALTPGAYTINVTATDYQNGTGNAAVTAGATVPAQVQLTPVDCTQPAFNPANVSVASGATPSLPLTACVYGLTHAENVTVTIRACKQGGPWKAILETVTGNYSEQTRILPAQTEVTGPGGNTTAANFCAQATELNSLGGCPGQWYMLSAVVAHENVHASRLLPALQHASVTPVLRTAIEALSVPDAPGMTKASAVAAIQALPGFAAALSSALTNWTAQYHVLIANDHSSGGPTDQAEHGVVDPMVRQICQAAKTNAWGACAVCPP